VACGTGVVSRTAARKAAPGGSVTGIDLGEPTLAIARAHPADEGAVPIEYIQADATKLPVADAAFDVVLCQQGLQFIPDRIAALGEMRRALTSGGRLAVATWTAIESNPFGVVADALARHVSEETAQMLRSPFALSADDLRAAVEQAGFGDIDLREETKDCTWATQRDFARRSIAAGPVASLFAAAPEPEQQAVADEVAERLAPNATPDGRLTMPMTTFVVLARA
jgi:ubiquinone/menaquinone biosynthesis C-methylase UbiE